MQLLVRKSSVMIRAFVFLLFAALSAARGDDILVADGPGQNLTSINRTYFTTTAQPAMLAIHAGTILSIGDTVAVLPLGGLTGVQAQGFGSRIVAENPNITGLQLGPTGVSGARAVDEGLVTIIDGKIEIAGDDSFGLFGDNGTVAAKGTLTISLTGIDSHGVQARGIGSGEDRSQLGDHDCRKRRYWYFRFNRRHGRREWRHDHYRGYFVPIRVQRRRSGSVGWDNHLGEFQHHDQWGRCERFARF